MTAINLFTQGYNQCWDLKEENPTVVYATDVNGYNTHQNITIRGFQALGRARDSKKNLYHITNMKKFQETLRTEEEIVNNNLDAAQKFILAANVMKALFKDDPEDVLEETIKKFTDTYGDFIEIRGNEVKIKHSSIDRKSNEELGNQHYLNAETLKQAWMSKDYTPTYIHRVDEWSKAEKLLGKRKESLESKRKAIFDKMNYLVRLETTSHEYLENEHIKSEYKEYWNYITALGYEALEQMKWNTRDIKKKYERYLEQQTMNSGAFQAALRKTFIIGQPYKRDVFKEKTQDLFDKFKIKSRLATGTTFQIFSLWENVARLEGTDRLDNDHAFKITQFINVSGWV